MKKKSYYSKKEIDSMINVITVNSFKKAMIRGYFSKSKLQRNSLKFNENDYIFCYNNFLKAYVKVYYSNKALELKAKGLLRK